MALHKCSKCTARYPDDIESCPQCGQATKEKPKRTTKPATSKKKGPSK